MAHLSSSTVVGTFPNRAAALHLVDALLMEQNDEWAVGRSLMEQNDEWAVGRRYFSVESMAAVTAPGEPIQLALAEAALGWPRTESRSFALGRRLAGSPSP